MLRFILVAILIFLLIRTFALYNREEEKRKMYERKNASFHNRSKISKNVGEFVDYEEIED
ncbi:MAG TPA: hypothetical protein GXZ49_08165 [Bacteroidetes bacterium]|jgi:large-conductance mechanosensitive channel|nr:hypothetical protein [Bacteroidota bacterium]